jgi:hypothetical protein
MSRLHTPSSERCAGNRPLTHERPLPPRDFVADEALLPPPHPICPRPGARTSASRRACAQILRYRHPGARGDWLPGCGAPAARQTLEPTATLVLCSLNMRHFLANALVRARGHPTFHVCVEEPRCFCSSWPDCPIPPQFSPPRPDLILHPAGSQMPCTDITKIGQSSLHVNFKISWIFESLRGASCIRL